MPRLNGTGPMGAGAMTGRGMGCCSKSNAGLEFYGRRMGRGFGFRRFYAAPDATPEQTKDILEQQKSFLERELASIDEQINKL